MPVPYRHSHRFKILYIISPRNWVPLFHPVKRSGGVRFGFIRCLRRSPCWRSGRGNVHPYPAGRRITCSRNTQRACRPFHGGTRRRAKGVDAWPDERDSKWRHDFGSYPRRDERLSGKEQPVLILSVGMKSKKIPTLLLAQNAWDELVSIRTNPVVVCCSRDLRTYSSLSLIPKRISHRQCNFLRQTKM